MIPRIQFTNTGMIPPTRQELSNALWQMFRDAFGQDLNPDPRTPQGQLVTSLTAALVDNNDSMIELGNQLDPRYATGVWQEALGAIYFINRRVETSSVVMLSFIGLPGVVIPDGFIVIDDAGNEWATNGQATVDAGGSATVEAYCLTPGPIYAAPLTITTFKQTIEDLDRVENPAAAAPGSDEESRVDFELRRAASVAKNSKNMNNSVYGAVADISGVIDAFVIDNPTDNTITVGETNYSMIRNSLLVSVVGGNNQEIAKQILIKGGTGCSFVGNTDVVYFDTDSGNAFPPEYLVTFLRPTHITTYFRILVADITAVSFVALSAAKQSIIDQFISGENRARIAGTVIASAFMCSIDRNIRPIKIEVSTDGTTWEDYITFGVDQFPVTSLANISVEQV
ncbi:baseplate J/gp47 family protein [Methylobacillus sp.]|uniref:baseplate J/gp47 family protein n=1 Tax=Methylobacillus sp. TaxID=56818 RepID=UPI002FE3701D